MAEVSKIAPNQSRTELVKDILTDIQVLVQKELELAREDIREDVKAVTPRVKAFISGIVLVLISWAFLGNAIVHFLVGTQHVQSWVANLVVGSGFLLIGTVMRIASKSNLKKKISELKPPGVFMKGEQYAK